MQGVRQGESTVRDERAGRMLVRMSGQILHISVDVGFADEQIQGKVSDGAQQAQPFFGWIGLIGAIDGMLEGPRQGSAMPSARPLITERRGDATD